MDTSIRLSCASRACFVDEDHLFISTLHTSNSTLTRWSHSQLSFVDLWQLLQSSQKPENLTTKTGCSLRSRGFILNYRICNWVIEITYAVFPCKIPTLSCLRSDSNHNINRKRAKWWRLLDETINCPQTNFLLTKPMSSIVLICCSRYSNGRNEIQT